MSIELNGTNGITNTGAYTGDGLSIADGAPSGALNVDLNGNIGLTASNAIMSSTVFQAYPLYNGTYSPGTSPSLWQSSSGALSISTNGSERMKIDSAGRVTMPYQPSWNLQPTYPNTTTTDISSIINFQQVNGYSVFAQNVSVNGGRVTVPVTGKYWVGASWRQENSQSWYELSFFVNGIQKTRAGIWYTPQAYESINIFGLYNLGANDVIDVRIIGGSAMNFNGYDDTLTFFSGYLIG